MTASDWATVASLATALGTLVLAVATFSAVRSGNRTARAAELSLLTTLRPLLTPSRRTDNALKVNFGDDKWLRVPGSSGAAEMGGGDGTMGPADAVLYFALSLRNVGNGIAVLHGWRLRTERPSAAGQQPPPLSEFRMQTRDMYIAPGDIGFWQGALRDPDDPQYEMGRKVIEGHGEWVVDLLYGDEDGGQRVIGRFRCQPTPWTGSGETQETAEPHGAPDPREAPGPHGAADPREGPGPHRAPDPRDRHGSPSPAAGDMEHPVWMLTVARHWNIDRPDPRQADRPLD